jgi:hypothetical protein
LKFKLALSGCQGKLIINYIIGISRENHAAGLMKITTRIVPNQALRYTVTPKASSNPGFGHIRYYCAL